MNRFYNLPIKIKLTVLLVGLVSFFLLAACTVFVVNDLRMMNASLREHLTAIADVVGASVSTDSNSRDMRDTNLILSSLRHEQSILWAAVYNAEGEVVGRYRTVDTLHYEPPEPQQPKFEIHGNNECMLFREIREFHSRDFQGTVFVLATREHINRQLRRYGIFVGLGLISCLVLAFFVSLRLQRVISRPILNLVEATQTVTLDADFSVRVKKQSDDELGMLADEFNLMLAQIQARDLELARHRTHLQSLVDEQTTELQTRSQELSQFNVELAQSNRDLEQFAYVASHDLKEPLRAVSGYCQLLQRRYGDQLDEKALSYIEYAVDGTKRMQTLLNDLLEYSRVNRKGKPFQEIEVAMALKQAMANLRIPIRTSQAKITHDELPIVIADPTQIMQLLQNLISNGIKYHTQESPEIHLSATEKTEEWEFCVADNGIGIEPQYQEQIFVIFQRLHTRDEYAGTGVGLAVCKRIVDRHGGRIWIESTPGEGSRFYFTLPKKTDSISDQEDSGNATLPETAPETTSEATPDTTKEEK